MLARLFTRRKRPDSARDPKLSRTRRKHGPFPCTSRCRPFPSPRSGAEAAFGAKPQPRVDAGPVNILICEQAHVGAKCHARDT